MQRYTMYLFLHNALHVSGGSPAHHQELTTVNTASGFVKPLPLPAAIVDEFQLIHDSCELLMMGGRTA